MKVTLFRQSAPILIAAAALCLPLSARAQVANLESEPNNTLPNANIPASGGFGMQNGDYILGNCNNNDLDWFRVVTAQQLTRGIYRCTLTVQSSGDVPSSVLDVESADHSHFTIGGRTVADGFVANSWYTFGSQTSVNYRLAPGSGNYRSTLSVVPVPVTPIPSAVIAGELTISMEGFPNPQHDDRQIVVYYSSALAIPGYTAGTIGGTTSPSLHRTFGPGTYYIGVCTGHMFNENLPPADSNALPWRTPFVDTLICDYSLITNPRPVTFAVTHAGGQVVVPATVTGLGGVAWFSLTVLPAASNDTCATATQLGIGTPIYGESTTVALANDAAPTCGGPSIDTAGVWYEFPGSGGTMTIAVNPDGNYNPRIHGYCAQGGCGALTCVGSSDVSPRGVVEMLSIATDPGATYKVLVSGSTSGFDSPTGTFSINVTDDGIPTNAAIVCSPRGACSVGGVCQILSAGACAQRGGSFCGEGTSCDAQGTYAVTSTAGFDLGELIGGGDGFVALGDDVSAQLSLPFAFPFFGVPKTSLFVSSNGYVTFDAINTSIYQNTPIPATAGPNSAIYGLWQDLITPNLGYQTRGTAPNRRFIMEWNHVSHYLANDPNNTFQIVLFEDGHIEMRYADLNIPLARGATIGVENVDGTTATSFDAQQLDGFYRTVNFTYTPGVPSCTPPCRADFNGDGTLDPDDLADFIGAYFAQPSAAGSDFNADGLTDPDDLADYIGAFFEGC